MALALIPQQAMRLLGRVLALDFVGLAGSESPLLGLGRLSCLRGGLKVLDEVEPLLVLGGEGICALLPTRRIEDATRIILIAEPESKVLQLLID